MSRRLAAIAAVAGGLVAIALTGYVFVAEFPRGIVVLAAVVGAAGAAWHGLLRRGFSRALGLAVAAALLAVGAAVLLAGSDRRLLLPIVVAAGLGGAATRRAFRPVNRLAAAPPVPSRPVLFVNPRSGDGAAARAGLAEAARRRGLETVELGADEDLEVLVRAAVGRGADCLAMAGGDGSQALVAGIAAEHDLPFACVPAGTRNHFALDLGVDREDVVGALDALIPGARERRIDLAEVDGRTFVNNVSLGVYAEAVGQRRYREAKVSTLLDSIAGSLGPERGPAALRWREPDGSKHTSGAVLLVTNDPYRLGPVFGAGTRPRLDLGRLGIVDFQPPAAGQRARGPLGRALSAVELTVDADGPVPLGVDGESLRMEPPLLFRSRPGALRVLVAPGHPGASPAASSPAGLLEGALALSRLALGREPKLGA